MEINFSDLSIEEIRDIRDKATETLKARDLALQKQALLEFASLMSKWDERGVSFYIRTNDDIISLRANDICVERK